MAAGIFFPIWAGQDQGVGFRLDPIHYTEFRETGEANTYLPYSITALLMAAAATISVMEIRRYNDRHTQIKMGTLNSLILMGAMISAVIFANQLTTGTSRAMDLWSCVVYFVCRCYVQLACCTIHPQR
ncbi:MAG: hypothetical protein RL161_115 [Bacteroidota bacterium]